MINSKVKRAYYMLLRYPMRINGRLYKLFRCPSEGLKVHLGPGDGNYLEGWLNVDANFVTARVDLWANFIDPLPFRDGSVDLFYSHHMIEHLPDSRLQGLFNQMFRALRPNGGIRIGVPHLGNSCRKYIENDHSWFPDFPDKRRSIGGKFTNYIFCRGEHLTALDETYLQELAESSGFHDVKFCMPAKETFLGDIGLDEKVLSMEWEFDPSCPHTLIMEARKPQSK